MVAEMLSCTVHTMVLRSGGTCIARFISPLGVLVRLCIKYNKFSNVPPGTLCTHTFSVAVQYCHKGTQILNLLWLSSVKSQTPVTSLHVS